MELVHCPSCDTFNPPGSETCQQCHQPIPETPEPPPSAPSSETTEPPPESERPQAEEARSAAEVAPSAQPSPPPFEASPEALARVEILRRGIAANPNAKALYLQLSQLYADAGRRDLGASVLEELLAVDSKNVYVRHRVDQLRRPAPPAAARALGGGTTATYSRPAGRTSLYPPRRSAPRGPIENLRALAKQRPWATIAVAACALALLFVFVRLLMPSTRQLVAGDFRAYDPQWSPSGRRFAFLIEQNDAVSLAVHDLRTHRIVARIGGWGERSFAWSPDGRLLAYVAQPSEPDWDAVINVLDVDSGQSREVGPGSSPVWCADNTHLIVRCRREGASTFDHWSEEWSPPTSGLCRLNAVTGDSEWLSAITQGSYEYSPELNMIAFERSVPREDVEASGPSPTREFEGFVDNVLEGDPRNVLEGRRNLAREIEARRFMDEKRGGADAEPSYFDSDILVMSAIGAEPTQITSDGRSSLISWTPDGERILYAVRGAAGIEIWTMDSSGGDKRSVLAAPLTVENGSRVALTPDGKHALFVSPVKADAGMAAIMTGEQPADLHVARVGSSSAKRLGNRHPFKRRFSLSPNGRKIIYEVLTDIKLIGGARRSELWLTSR